MGRLFGRPVELWDELCHLVLQLHHVFVGYAVLFKRMCQHFNIQVDYVGGYTKLTKSCINDTTDGDDIAKLSVHAWTMVHLDEKTYFTDPTWSAAKWSSSDETKSPFKNAYYLVVARHSIHQFRPHNNYDQHLDSPLTIEQFIHGPCFIHIIFDQNLLSILLFILSSRFKSYCLNRWLRGYDREEKAKSLMCIPYLIKTQPFTVKARLFTVDLSMYTVYRL